MRVDKAVVFVVVAGMAIVGKASAQDVATNEVEKLLDARTIMSSWTNTEASTGEDHSDTGSTDEEDPLVLKLVSDGFGLISEGEPSKSLSLFEQALALDPDSRKAQFGLGTAFIKLQRDADAVKLLEDLAATYPRDFTVKNNLAWLYATSADAAVRDGDRAVVLAQEALLLSKNDFHVWSTLAEAHYAAAQYDRAQRAAEEALRIALTRRLDAQRIDEYREQVKRCGRAARALSIVD